MTEEADMTTDQNMTVRIFDRESFSVPVTKIVIEVYPSPGTQQYAHWYLELPNSDEDEVDVTELEALMDATFAAGKQIERLLLMIDEQEAEDEL